MSRPLVVLLATLVGAALVPAARGDYVLFNKTVPAFGACAHMALNFSVSIGYNTTSGQHRQVTLSPSDPDVTVGNTSYCNCSVRCEKRLYEAALVLQWGDGASTYQLSFFFFENVTSLKWWMDGVQLMFFTHGNADFPNYTDPSDTRPIVAPNSVHPFQPVPLNGSYCCESRNNLTLSPNTSSSIISVVLTMSSWKLQVFNFANSTVPDFGKSVMCKLDQGGTSIVPPIVVAVVVILLGVVLLILFVITLVYDWWRSRNYQRLN